MFPKASLSSADLGRRQTTRKPVSTRFSVRWLKKSRKDKGPGLVFLGFIWIYEDYIT